MMRLRSALVCGLVLSGLFGSLRAQSAQEFQDFGQEVFVFLTDSSQSVPVELARLRIWRDWIDQQDWQHKQKELSKLDLQKNYAAHIQLFQRELAILQDRYFADRASGAELSLYDFQFETASDSAHYYHGTLYFIFEKGEMRSQARFQFPFLYHGRGFVLMAAPREEF